jgi:hypothetical protein
MLAGETADVIILSRPVMDELRKQDKFAPNSVVDIAGTQVGWLSARARRSRISVLPTRSSKRS